MNMLNFKIPGHLICISLNNIENVVIVHDDH